MRRKWSWSCRWGDYSSVQASLENQFRFDVMKTKAPSIQELDKVILTSKPDDGTPAGIIGIVTQVYNQGEAFKIEFKSVNPDTGMDGETCWYTTARREQIRLVRKDEIINPRFEVKAAALNIQGVKYQPWQGPLFDSDDKRVLVLGESFYHGEAGDPPSNINQIGPYKAANRKFEKDERTSWARHFHKTQDLFSSWPCSDPKEFWGRVAYYNYIPQSVGKTPGGKRTKDMWSSGIEPFKAVLMYLKPKRVLVLGFDLWGNMMNAPIVKKAENGAFRFLDEKTGPVLRVVGHPASRGFYTKLRQYQQTVKELLE